MRAETVPSGLLVLADGTEFDGDLVGEPGVVSGEVVFQTSMSGYQEVLTDPSYAGQIVTFTSPHIGNYGMNPVDDQTRRAQPRGIIVRALTGRAGSWRASSDIGDWLRRQGVTALTGVDTRALTRHLRTEGSMPGAFGPAEDAEKVRTRAQDEPGVTGADLVSGVTTGRPYRVGTGAWRVTAYDLGIKRGLLRGLGNLATVDVVPAGTSPEEVLDTRPDAVFLSNGPGDPAALDGLVGSVRELLGTVPIFGVCLGHQILASALGAKTYKLPFGHHGANHPVRRLGHERVEITTQNHNFAVASDTLPSNTRVTHVNLNDGVVEGLACREARAVSVQYHPEAAPGPHDADYLFGFFESVLNGGTPLATPR